MVPAPQGTLPALKLPRVAECQDPFAVPATRNAIFALAFRPGELRTRTSYILGILMLTHMFVLLYCFRGLLVLCRSEQSLAHCLQVSLQGHPCERKALASTMYQD